MSEDRGLLGDTWAFTKSGGSGIWNAGAGMVEGAKGLAKGGYKLVTDAEAREKAWETTKQLADATKEYGEAVYDDPWKAYRDARDGGLASIDKFEEARDLAEAEGRLAEFYGEMTGAGFFEVGTALIPIGLAAKAGKLGKVVNVADDVIDVAKSADKVEDVLDAAGKTERVLDKPVIIKPDAKCRSVSKCSAKAGGVKNTKPKPVVTNINGLGRVEGNFSAINPGPLPNNMADTFAGGKYQAVTLEKDTILSRAGTADQPLGQFFDLDTPSSVVQTRIDKAVLPVWPGGAKSPIDTAFEVKIPAKTEVYVGEVGSQGGVFVGGTQQIVVPKPWTIDGVEVINSSPLK